MQVVFPSPYTYLSTYFEKAKEWGLQPWAPFSLYTYPRWHTQSKRHAARWTHKRNERYSHKYQQVQPQVLSRSSCSYNLLLWLKLQKFQSLEYLWVLTWRHSFLEIILVEDFFAFVNFNWRFGKHVRIWLSPCARKNRNALCAQSNLLFSSARVSKKSSLRVHMAFLKNSVVSLLMLNS